MARETALKKDEHQAPDWTGSMKSDQRIRVAGAVDGYKGLYSGEEDGGINCKNVPDYFSDLKRDQIFTQEVKESTKL